MKAYACVYRRSIPAKSHLDATTRDAANDPTLQKFLAAYFREDRYFDWGDDPSFFAASEMLGDVRRASWGVCRPDVRETVEKGSFIAFFCAKPRLSDHAVVDYYYIGVGTVRTKIDRSTLWTDAAYQPYRQFYNVLATMRCGKEARHERFHPYHENWRKRLSPYVIFEANDELTQFNIETPLYVATYRGGKAETWKSDLPASRLKELLFGKHLTRQSLRTSHTGFAHPKLRLCGSSTRLLHELRKELIDIARAGELA